MQEMTGSVSGLRVDAEARLVLARAEGNHYDEAAALADLVEITHQQGDVYGLVIYAERAWEAAETNSYWDQLSRLAQVFGDIAYHVQEYSRAFDHFANSIAFASMASTDEYLVSVGHVDSILADLMASGRGAVAAAFAEMLVGYEAAGGLGRPDPAFSSHYQLAKSQAEQQATFDLSLRGIKLN